jgi:hypothetical protein
MVVHLDCNRLSLDAKRALFVSNREESRRGIVQNLILHEMINALKADERLAELNEEARLATTKTRDENAEKEIRREVAKMLKFFGFSAAEEVAGAKATGGGEKGNATPVRVRPKPEPIPVNEPPSFFIIVDDEPVRFHPGQRKFLRLRTDAHSKYHNAESPAESAFSFIAGEEKMRFAGSSELRNGHMRAAFALDADASVGAQGTITIELRPKSSPTLSASVSYVVVPQPPAKPAGTTVTLPSIDCQPIDSVDSEEWLVLDWPKDIAEVAADYSYSKEKDLIEIRYSTLFPRYRGVIDAFAHDPGKRQSFQKRYEIWLTTSILVHWQDTLQDQTKISDADLEEDRLDDYRRDEIRRMSKVAVLYAQREVSLSTSVANLDHD